MDRAIVVLREIGRQLDEDIFPCVKKGGIVAPSEAAVPTSIWTEEKNYEKSGQRGPETRTWTRPARWERQANGRKPTSKAAPIVCPDLQAKYENELTVVHEAYPGTRVWQQAEGLWLMTESGLLPGLWQKALFLTGIPFVRTLTVRTWGFWMGVPLRYPTWIGPRHTNFPDGSVCAFEPGDCTWNLGDSILELLDLYTLWALRHLHLQVLGRWPGRQVAHHPYERITELREDESCGCGSDKLYGICCREKNLARDRVIDAVDFNLHTGGVRMPHDEVVSFIREQTGPPRLTDMLAR